ncbi:cupin domain-containing protein [Helicobacter sp. 13S00477-4]|uniref:cupin domain-containing protein n=1 Tax=Helicobacter sp. 13S00477-4 TaxID=1905759 RepID=UPI0015DAC284|nr:cupin domain-containing protein [Helicobacter sp. 13S00477-4]
MDKKFEQIFPIGEKNEAYSDYFVGQSYLKKLSTEGINIINVTFEPGCRNNWHIHHNSRQILLVTAGKGYYQEWGKNPKELNPGDVINIPPEVKHWHGAAPSSWFSHIAIEVPDNNDVSKNEFLEVVNQADYEKLK